MLEDGKVTGRVGLTSDRSAVGSMGKTGSKGDLGVLCVEECEGGGAHKVCESGKTITKYIKEMGKGVFVALTWKKRPEHREESI